MGRQLYKDAHVFRISIGNSDILKLDTHIYIYMTLPGQNPDLLQGIAG